MTPDKRALRILSDTFWSPMGWKPKPNVSAEDLAYAKAKGVMFDPMTLSHDEATRGAAEAVSATNQNAVVQAFVASLSSRRLDLRSAFGSYAVGRHMHEHKISPSGPGQSCSYCGGYEVANADPNILNFERIKWGGVRHYQPQYIALDLGIFGSTTALVPSNDDLKILRSIFEIAKSMPPKSRLGDLDKALAKAFPSNSAERRTLISIFGYAGILVDPSRPDFRLSFVPCVEREQTPWHKDDWPYPVQWWNGSFGVNQAAAADWFSEFK